MFHFEMYLVGMTLQNYLLRLEFVSLLYGTNSSKLVMYVPKFLAVTGESNKFVWNVGLKKLEQYSFLEELIFCFGRKASKKLDKRQLIYMLLHMACWR